MPRVLPNGGVGPTVQVWDTEEKGSDVNLAVELVNDAWSNLFDLAVVISNDSDLERAILTVKRKGRRVGVLVRGDARVVSLRKAASFVRMLSEVDLTRALLPREIPDSSIRIPEEWLDKERRAAVR